MITKKEVIERIEKVLGPEYIAYLDGHYYLVFDKFTDDVWILEHFKLQTFLTKNKNDTFTRINVKLLVDVHNIRELYGKSFAIGETFTHARARFQFKEDHMCERYHREGNALEIIPLTKTYLETRELYKVIRKYKKEGARIIFDTHIHIDCMLKRFADRRKKKAV